MERITYMRHTNLFIKLVLIFMCSSCCYGRRSKSHSASVHTYKQSFLNVEDFGAKADGKTDNYQAFKETWDSACSSFGSPRILVPESKTYFVKHVNFSGPCSSSVSLEIRGTIKSFPQMYDLPRRLWIKFEDVENLEILGGGTIDGNGQEWWNHSCKIKKTKPCQSQNAPTALTFKNCTNLKVSNVKVKNAQQMHMNFEDSNNVKAWGLSVAAPEHSPNTDGIHITRTTNIYITDSVIGTGDDCISMVNGSRNVQVTNVACGPGHGISIGSLGENGSENIVSGIFVKGVKMTGTTNGVRIKTWQGGHGTARNIEFDDIEMSNVSNPIIIDQHYCDKNKKCKQQKSGVQIENIMYKNIRGTSASKVAINFNCSESVPCRNIRLEKVDLAAHKKGRNVEAFCSQLTGLSEEQQYFPSCSKKLT